MAYYDGFMACNYAQPKQYWQEQLQEMVNQEFDNASTVQYDIEEEVSVLILSVENTIQILLSNL